jgi:hypothetical protein
MRLVFGWRKGWIERKRWAPIGWAGDYGAPGGVVVAEGGLRGKEEV